MDLLKKIKFKLEQALPGSKAEVRNESSQHLGHSSGGAHIGVIVSYPGFKGLPIVKQHQMIYKILEQEMKKEIHSLQITTKVNNY
ncbi:MAG TPA: BolA family protein [Candidatus Nanoarchaeia archaeon]|nr:BolA family protein [Candidatus Nanoarchaeia archaeon]